jgi:methionine biosynthesis protein MetW
MSPPKFRYDHKVIFELIEPRSRVLDLGCGDGSLLAHLIQAKECRGTGIEINEAAIYECVAKGLSVSHANINTGLTDFSDKRFDYVILNESLQEILHPKSVILEALRVGRKVIIGIPNFCNASARTQIFFKGRVPVTSQLPHQWYDTPNLRFLSLKDFRNFCGEYKIKILKEVGITDNKPIRFWPNLFAHIGIYLIEK